MIGYRCTVIEVVGSLDSLKCHQIESKRSKIQKFPGGGGGGACPQTPLDGALTALRGHKSMPQYVKIPGYSSTQCFISCNNSSNCCYS